MKLGDKVRALRIQRSLTQQTLVDRLDVSMSYISKIERGRLHFGDYPSDKFIGKLAHELVASEDELLILCGKLPPTIRDRMFSARSRDLTTQRWMT